MNTIKKPKIALLSIRNTYNYGGVLSSLKVMHDFCQQYFEPTVFFLGFDQEIATSIKRLKFTSTEKKLTYFGMHCVEIGARWAFWEPGHYAYTIKTWQKLLCDFDYFIVVSGTCIAAHPVALLDKPFMQWIGTPYHEDRAERVKKLTGIRALINALASRPMENIEKEILEKASYTLAISSYAKQRFEEITQKQNFVTCGYPVDCSKTASIISGISGTNNNKEKIILAVGRFSDPRKNVEMLVAAFEKIYAQDKNCLLYVVGKQPINETMNQLSTSKCFENIIFTGQLSMADLTALYQRSSLMLITSHQEGLGIVGLEAMLHGTPVIATKCGGTQDYVIENITGHLVDINDAQTMATKALLLLENYDLLTIMGKNARDYIKKHFSLESIHEQFKTGLIKTYPELNVLFDEARLKNQELQDQVNL